MTFYINFAIKIFNKKNKLYINLIQLTLHTKFIKIYFAAKKLWKTDFLKLRKDNNNCKRALFHFAEMFCKFEKLRSTVFHFWIGRLAYLFRPKKNLTTLKEKIKVFIQENVFTFCGKIFEKMIFENGVFWRQEAMLENRAFFFFFLN